MIYLWLKFSKPKTSDGTPTHRYIHFDGNISNENWININMINKINGLRSFHYSPVESGLNRQYNIERKNSAEKST